jgi:hypothetical protein
MSRIEYRGFSMLRAVWRAEHPESRKRAVPAMMLTQARRLPRVRVRFMADPGGAKGVSKLR